MAIPNYYPDDYVDDYAWIIDKDHLESPGDAGVMGPRFAPDSLLATLKTTTDGIPFRIYDDDGELYYSGRIIYADGSTDGDMEPLDDYGAPNAGASEIHYRNARGKWEVI